MDNLSIKQRRKFRYRDGVSMQDVIKVNRNLTQEKFDIKITENNNDVKMLLVNPLHNLWIFFKNKGRLHSDSEYCVSSKSSSQILILSYYIKMDNTSLPYFKTSDYLKIIADTTYPSPLAI